MNLKNNKLVKYIIEAKGELKKVTWPTKKQTTKYTLTVIGISLFVAAFMGVFDYVFTKALAWIL